jgi:hypothetical protein
MSSFPLNTFTLGIGIRQESIFFHASSFRISCAFIPQAEQNTAKENRIE